MSVRCTSCMTIPRTDSRSHWDSQERSGDKYIAHADIDATVPADFDVRKVETSDE